MPRLLIATSNAHKVAEIQAMLSESVTGASQLPAWEVSNLSAYPAIGLPEENGASFAANAEIKAVAASRWFDGLVVADDSGLEVDVIGGAPGIYSARYAAIGATDAENRTKLRNVISEILGARFPPQSARFRCAMVVAEGGAPLASFAATVEGVILAEERGIGGFGYDSLFVPAGHARTFAELPQPVKNEFSHRGRAMAKLQSFLAQWALATSEK